MTASQAQVIIMIDIRLSHKLISMMKSKREGKP